MRLSTRALAMAMLLAGCNLALLSACSSKDRDRQPTGPTAPTAADALAGYWQAGGQAQAALAEAEDLWAVVADLAANPAVAADATMQAVLAYAASCSVAATRLNAWEDLERRIVPDAGKAQIGEVSRATALAVLANTATATVASGEGLVLSWRVLGGLRGLREALQGSGTAIPVTGTLAELLQERLQARDEAVTAAILHDDDRSGGLAIDELEGDTADARAAFYADLDDHHPLKRSFRAAVPAWDAAERALSLALLERAARGHLRLFAGVGAGTAQAAEIANHLTAARESDPANHGVTLALRRADGGPLPAGSAMVLLRRRGLPHDSARLALLTGVASQAELVLPAGSYDILALADDHGRAIACGVAIDADAAIDLALNHLGAEPLIFEGLIAPSMSGAGDQLEVKAVAASSAGHRLQYTWRVSGGPVGQQSATGARFLCRPDAAGSYTVAVTVSDGRGNARADSAVVAVTPFAVKVTRMDIVSEQIADQRLNPGESDTLRLWVTNRGAIEVTGAASLSGRGGLLTDVSSGTWTLGVGQTTRWRVPVAIPAAWDQPQAVYEFSFTADGETLRQELVYPVDFYVSLNRIGGTVTNRIVPVSGMVANPSLETAQLIVERDRRQIYNLQLRNGAFEQVVILPGSDQPRRVVMEVTADSGLRRASAQVGLMAAVARADFRATLFWDTDGTDVDLWVTDPDGERCYFANRNTASGLQLDVDDVNGYGPENITGQSDLPPGEYLVQVHYWSDRGTNLPSRCSVLITLHEASAAEQVEMYEQVLTNNQVWTVATVLWDGAEAALVAPAATGAVAPLAGARPQK